MELRGILRTMRWPWSKPKASARPALRYFSDLKISDYITHPVWQDVENSDVIGDGYAMPYVGCLPIDLESFVGTIACEFQASNGVTFQGLIETCFFSNPDDLWSLTYVIIAATPPHVTVDLNRAVIDDFCSDGTEKHISLDVPCPDDVANAVASREALRKLVEDIRVFTGLTTQDLFPMNCKPRVAIKSFPESWFLEGFLSQSRDGNNIFVR